MAGLIQSCPPLDVNSTYLYLLLAEHFPQTCVLAEDDQGLCGLVTAYRPPTRQGVLFVWQVAVAPRARGTGLGITLIQDLLARPGSADVRSIETTVGPGNRASRRMFERLAARLDAPLVESAFFDAELFGAGNHEAEPLLRIGPFESPAALGADGISTTHQGEHHGLENF